VGNRGDLDTKLARMAHQTSTGGCCPKWLERCPQSIGTLSAFSWNHCPHSLEYARWCPRRGIARAKPAIGVSGYRRLRVMAWLSMLCARRTAIRGPLSLLCLLHVRHQQVRSTVSRQPTAGNFFRRPGAADTASCPPKLLFTVRRLFREPLPSAFRVDWANARMVSHGQSMNKPPAFAFAWRIP
jgi:hypothetical protein